MSKPEKIRCDACPVMCYVAEGMTGACDRYANEGGKIGNTMRIRQPIQYATVTRQQTTAVLHPALSLDHTDREIANHRRQSGTEGYSYHRSQTYMRRLIG